MQSFTTTGTQTTLSLLDIERMESSLNMSFLQPIVQKYKLNHTMSTMTKEFIDTIFETKINLIYKIFVEQDAKEQFFKLTESLPYMQPTDYQEYINNFIEKKGNNAQILQILNNMMHSKDIDFLQDTPVYKDLLKEQVCIPPNGIEETINAMEQVQAIMKDRYNSLLAEMKVGKDKCKKDNFELQ